MIIMLGSKGEDVRSLQLHLAAHGFPCGAIDGDFGNKTLAAVKAFQTAAGLTPHGVVEELTWNAVLQPPVPRGRDELLALAGRMAAAAAIRRWELDIFDPPIGSKDARSRECLIEIERIIKRNGWGFATPYRGNGPPQWCTMFAGDVWADAGLDTSWLVDYFASTHRLGLWARYKKFSIKSKPNPAPTTPDRRLFIDLKKPLTITPRPGDIVIVGDGDPDEGDHGTVLIGFNPSSGTFDTISGNGGGKGPRGNKREGISRRDFTIGQGGYQPMFLVRPALGDLVKP